MGVQFLRGHVTVVRFINRKRGSPDKGADMPAVLQLTAQLFRCALCILADGLAEEETTPADPAIAAANVRD